MSSRPLDFSGSDRFGRNMAPPFQLQLPASSSCLIARMVSAIAGITDSRRRRRRCIVVGVFLKVESVRCNAAYIQITTLIETAA